MIISNVSSGPKVDYSLNGTVLTIGTDVSIDLQQRQNSNESVIDVCLDNQLTTMREGLGAWYVATITVPPIEQELYDTGKKDNNGDTIYDVKNLPLDMNQVKLQLWALPENYGKTAPSTGGTV